MYPPYMRRIQIYIQEDLDDVLQIEAAKRNQAKASLIRECVLARYGSDLPTENDPLAALMAQSTLILKTSTM